MRTMKTIIAALFILSIVSCSKTPVVEIVTVEYKTGELLITSDGESWYLDEQTVKFNVGDTLYKVHNEYANGRPERSSYRVIKK